MIIIYLLGLALLAFVLIQSRLSYSFEKSSNATFRYNFKGKIFVAAAFFCIINPRLFIYLKKRWINTKLGYVVSDNGEEEITGRDTTITINDVEY